MILGIACRNYCCCAVQASTAIDLSSPLLFIYLIRRHQTNRNRFKRCFLLAACKRSLSRPGGQNHPETLFRNHLCPQGQKQSCVFRSALLMCLRFRQTILLDTYSTHSERPMARWSTAIDMSTRSNLICCWCFEPKPEEWINWQKVQMSSKRQWPERRKDYHSQNLHPC